jgi:aspartyl-tRNA(Asn)/glutamyl-tRNA(Gln) amidotransferase subunit C
VTVSRAEVLRIAGLARLGLTDGEIERLAAEMNEILGHVDVLRALDGGESEPESGGCPDDPGSKARPGPDFPDPLAAPPSALAPEWRAELFAVPPLPGLGQGEETDG